MAGSSSSVEGLHDTTLRVMLGMGMIKNLGKLNAVIFSLGALRWRFVPREPNEEDYQKFAARLMVGLTFYLLIVALSLFA
jgi:hypothetical protein